MSKVETNETNLGFEFITLPEFPGNKDVPLYVYKESSLDVACSGQAPVCKDYVINCLSGPGNKDIIDCVQQLAGHSTGNEQMDMPAKS